MIKNILTSAQPITEPHEKNANASVHTAKSNAVKQVLHTRIVRTIAAQGEKMRTFVLALSAVCALAIPASAGEKKGTIGCTLLAFSNPFYKEIGDNMTAEAAKNGYDVIITDGNFDAVRQNNQIKDFIASGVAAIVIAPADSKAIGASIREANDAGIPVFTVDIGNLDPAAEVICHVATDNYAGGKMAADAMIQALPGGKGKIGIINHPEVEAVILRTDGFKARLKELGKENDIRIVADLPGLGSRDRSYAAAQDMLQAHPDIEGIFCINDPTALGAIAALEGIGKLNQVVLVGFDGQPEGKQAIRDGKIFADPIQFPDQLGREVVKMFIKYTEGEEVPKEHLIPTALYYKEDGMKDASLK